VQTTADSIDRTVVPEGALYVTARQLERRYQVSRKWVSARAAFLGATPISDAPNSELRFHLPTADAYMEGRRRSEPARAPRRRRAKDTAATTRTGAPLLPFKQS
jgi:hypothetical protein